jgi:hypothetical protein
MAVRQALRYPPFTRMVRFLAAGPEAEKRAKALANALRPKLGADGAVTAAPTFYGNGREWHVLLRAADPLPLLEGLDLAEISVDVDPVDCL